MLRPFGVHVPFPYLGHHIPVKFAARAHYIGPDYLLAHIESPVLLPLLTLDLLMFNH